MEHLDVIGVFFGLFYALATIVLLGRVSHWAHATQEKLDKTNGLLADLLLRR